MLHTSAHTFCDYCIWSLRVFSRRRRSYCSATWMRRRSYRIWSPRVFSDGARCGECNAQHGNVTRRKSQKKCVRSCNQKTMWRDCKISQKKYTKNIINMSQENTSEKPRKPWPDNIALIAISVEDCQQINVAKHCLNQGNLQATIRNIGIRTTYQHCKILFTC